MSSSSFADTLFRGSKLIAFLVLLPALLTAGHFAYTFQKNGILLVDSPSHSVSGVTIPNGIYWSSSPLQDSQGAYYWRQEENVDRKKLFGWLPAWPSVSQLAASLLHSQEENDTKLEFLSRHGSYCFKTSEYTLCPNEKDNARLDPPALAQWKVVEGKKTEDPNILVELRIRSFHWFKYYYFQHEEKPFQQLFQRPATCLLLALNIGLAFCYWNYRVNPNQVALMDGPILQQFQYWRAITGSLAHFEWWHLLFNMMSLHNLGQFLEEQYYGSIGFLFYNLALIPLTVLIFLGGIQLVYAILKKASPGNSLSPPPTINAVGYSGVLFAWMVVAALDQTRSCPIPFFTSVCFDTWHLTKNIRFNVGPLIQLMVAQVILPRVSFGGHLAGIIAGFLLHWNLLPLELVQPSVLIPLLTLVQWKNRQFIPIGTTSSSGKTSGRNFLDEAGIDDEDNRDLMEAKLPSSGLCRHPVGTSHLLTTLLSAMGVLLAGSVAMMSWGSALLFAQAALMALFYVCYQAYTDHWDDEGEQDNWLPGASQKKHRMLSLWKGFIASGVLVVALESVTLACWAMMSPSMFTHAYWWGLGLLIALMAIHLIALSVACLHWEGIGGEQEEKGIFEYSLGFAVLDNAKVVGHNLVAVWTSSRRHKGKSPSAQSGKRSAKNMAAVAAERRARATAESEMV